MGSVDVSPKAAAKRGVEVIPLDWYSRGRLTREGLQLCFAALDAREIRRGVQELAIALQDFRASSLLAGAIRLALHSAVRDT